MFDFNLLNLDNLKIKIKNLVRFDFSKKTTENTKRTRGIVVSGKGSANVTKCLIQGFDEGLVNEGDGDLNSDENIIKRS